VEGLRSRREALQFAAALAQERSPAGAAHAIWLDKWKPGQACLAVAMDIRLRNALHRVFDQAGVQFEGLVPWWAEASNALCSAGDGPRVVVCKEADVSTLIGVREGQIEWVETLDHPEQDGDALRAMVRRALVGGNFSSTKVCQVNLVSFDPGQASNGADVSAALPLSVEVWP